MLISIKRNNLLRTFENYITENENYNKDELEKKYDTAYEAYLDSLDNLKALYERTLSQTSSCSNITLMGDSAGGGLALIQVAECLEKADTSELSDDAKVGFKIVKRALEEPIRQIAENAGLDGAVIADKAKHEKKGVGFDAAKMEWKDMVAAGIIDPAKVTRSALQNAASVASMVLTTESLVTDIKDPQADAAQAAAMAAAQGGGMY